MNKNTFLNRVKNPIFLLAATSLLYQALKKYNLVSNLESYQQFIDLITYIFIGTGIYSTFEKKNILKNEEE